MASKRKLITPNEAPYKAERIAQIANQTREGRDRLTRVWAAPIKGADTQSRQWMRYNP
jgi:hypothetical protein